MTLQGTTSTHEGAVRAGSLREALDSKRVQGDRFTLKETIAIIVPLCTELAALHASGRRAFLHPSAIHRFGSPSFLDVTQLEVLPPNPRDRAAVAPECRKGQPGDASASVFSVGAILYELLTGEAVGPGMKRPTQVDPSLPPQLEIILGKALVADAKHRPHDIAALAQALHHLAPNASMAPPSADESHLDHEADFDVDVSLSMLPPAPSHNGTAQRRAAPDPFAVVAPVSTPNPVDPTVQLAALKTRLESDPRPRYIVVKDGMDHGPFSAVEMLQQIASHAFLGDHIVRDDQSGLSKPLEQWDDFAPFAQQAHLNREIKQERQALEVVVQNERQRMQWKVLAGVSLLVLLGAAAGGWWVRKRAMSKNDQVVREDKAQNIDTDEALAAKKREEEKARAAGNFKGGGSSGGGTIPVVAGGGSCESARNKYVEDYTNANGTPPDLQSGAFAGLNNGAYLNSCGVPDSMRVSICAAIQNGRAVGVTVTTSPSNAGIAGCIKSQVFGMSFPSHPRMDITTTTFAAK
ncbi:MAG: hypothetical protein U0271_32880 [Polyangiaceae bacterium]